MNLKISVGIICCGLLTAVGCSLTDTSELGSGTGNAAGASGAGASSGGEGGVGGSGGGASGAGGASGSAGAGGDLATGAVCEQNSDCTSDFCVDGVCCDSACTGSCEACSAANKGSGADGVCGPVNAGGDPDAECEDQGPTSCGTNGSCDGAGACALYSTETQCSDSTCSAGVRTLPGHCDGAGACAAGTTEDCEQGSCDGPVCLGQCQSDASCPPGDYCDPVAGACTPKLPNGDPCQSNQANRCQSGICTDGTCCDSVCDGRCEGCATGTCTPHAAAVDPDSDCSADAASTCGQDGSCDGAGGCKLYAGSTQCAAATCVGTSTYAAPATCNGSGSCSNAVHTPCDPFICSGNACRNSCTSSAHCVEGSFCIVAEGKCEPLLSLGNPCETSEQCKSGFCVDGMCCDRACTGLCEACSEEKSKTDKDGICSPIREGGDPDNECTDQGVASCQQDGMCDGARACRKYREGVQCGSACSSSSSASVSNCKLGACVASSNVACAPYTCVGTACRTTCSSNTDCASGKVCVGNACVTALAQGATCSSGAQCASTHCVDGVCCDTKCTGTCKTCAGDVSPRGTCGDIECGPQGAECSIGQRCVFGACGGGCL